MTTTKKAIKEREIWKEFSHNPISHTTAHYLTCIQDLKNKNGYARLIDVAKCLDISPGSCSTTIKSISKKGLILEDENKFLSLSDKGSKLVKNIKTNSQLLTKLFHNVLKVSEQQSKIDACKIEHLLSPETSVRLKQYLKDLEQ
jgi:Mn-dependent DtxR family transcriptional regulator